MDAGAIKFLSIKLKSFAGPDEMILLQDFAGLLAQYYPDANKSFICGHNIKEFKREDLRCMFGMVLQDTWLYNDTIMENVRYGWPGASAGAGVKPRCTRSIWVDVVDCPLRAPRRARAAPRGPALHALCHRGLWPRADGGLRQLPARALR